MIIKKILIIKKIKAILGKKKKLMKVELLTFFNMLAVFGLIFAMYIFCIGFHNVDMGHNMKWLNCEYNLSLVDETNQGRIVDSFEAYSMGWWQIRKSIILFISSAFLFGASLSDIMNLIKKRKC